MLIDMNSVKGKCIGFGVVILIGKYLNNYHSVLLQLRVITIYVRVYRLQSK